MDTQEDNTYSHTISSSLTLMGPLIFIAWCSGSHCLADEDIPFTQEVDKNILLLTVKNNIRLTTKR